MVSCQRAVSAYRSTVLRPQPRCRAIARRAWHTVKRFADASTPEDLFSGQWQNRPSVLDKYKPYLDDRWNEGFTNAWKLWAEIVPLGYTGSYQRVRAYLHKRTSPRSVTARPPSPRTVSGWILSRPETLTEPEQLQLKAVLMHCPELDAFTRQVRSFASMLTERQGGRLAGWLDAVRQDGLPRLHALAAGIDRDLDAVTAGLTLPWSSGAVEGHVNRMKMLSAKCSAAPDFNCSASGFSSLHKQVSTRLGTDIRSGCDDQVRVAGRLRQRLPQRPTRRRLRSPGRSDRLARTT